MQPTIDLTAPAVAVLGDATRVTGLARQLPAAWRVLHTPGIEYVQAGELVLLVGPDVAAVRRTHRRMPAGCVLAVLVDQDANAATIADVLQAGADVCVRAGSTTILASHLVACHRRRTRPPSPPVEDERATLLTGADRLARAVTR
ncbi:hypothetical protein Q2K19_05645 [Micromonospora soli]|uniref:hypothetical protein n=1 Tax=Micromonospora sp. NBRC 110009 TaxID=3061627 RepID=UPI0026727441|nr:hypothetical protein [Micromonospora sp. NBRC 110009]WKT99973.1 hypothetical protein Q2K19_05645 [Micromonospora sp. NBRC 110009]